MIVHSEPSSTVVSALVCVISYEAHATKNNVDIVHIISLNILL